MVINNLLLDNLDLDLYKRSMGEYPITRCQRGRLMGSLPKNSWPGSGPRDAWKEAELGSTRGWPLWLIQVLLLRSFHWILTWDWEPTNLFQEHSVFKNEQDYELDQVPLSSVGTWGPMLRSEFNGEVGKDCISWVFWILGLCDCDLNSWHQHDGETHYVHWVRVRDLGKGPGSLGLRPLPMGILIQIQRWVFPFRSL